jgi:PPOX class probable F420-dependent enzyme
VNRSSALDLFSTARIARLATITPDGSPHIVPITFAADSERIYTMVDHKPKSSTLLKRLANIAANPRVSLLADHYEDDWRALWWVRIDGAASVTTSGESYKTAQRLLTSRYPQYVDQVPSGPAIVVSIDHVSFWDYQSNFPSTDALDDE